MISPVSLSYPESTSADQAFGGFTLDSATKQYLFATASVSLYSAGHAAAQAECQLADGTSAGFSDTTYSLTTAQLLAGAALSAY